MSKKHRAAAVDPLRVTSISPSHDSTAQRTRLILCATCFVSGAATLVIELAGNRLLAPLFGNSLYTWTSLIGVVLVAISVGDYLGGVLVDRAPRLSLLGYLLLSAAAWTLLVPALHAQFIQSSAPAGLITGPLVVSLMLFAVPACLLAAVCPFIVRLLSRSTHDQSIGLSAGLVGMLATLGSFVGTFLTGFYLIPEFGVRSIFLTTGLLIGLLGAVVLVMSREDRRTSPVIPVATVALLALINFMATSKLPSGVVFERQTFYHDIRVEETTSELGERVRLLKLDTTLEGGQYVDTGGVYLSYQHYWRLAEVFAPRLDRALFLGGGGFAMPEQLAKRHGESRIDVVEIDPAVIDVGRRYFGLNNFPAVTPHAGDARRYLLDTREKYDLIFGDAYNGLRNIPGHLVTQEFFALLKSRLADDGLYMMNIVSPIRGENAQLFRAILKTVQTQFAHTDVYSVDPRFTAQPRGVILVASNRQLSAGLNALAADELLKLLLSTRIEPALYEPLDVQPLTDDHNPSEYLIARQLSRQPHSD